MTDHVARIAVILPVYNRKEITLKCLGKLHEFDNTRYRLHFVLVDDGSPDGTGDAVREAYPNVDVLEGDGNLWWAGGVNKGFKYVADSVQCEYILLMNDDSNFNQSTLDVLFNYIKTKKNICASATALYEFTNIIYCTGHSMNGRFKNMIPLFQGYEINEQIPRIIKCDSISSRFVLMPLKILNEVGIFDENKFKQSYSDIEYFLRAKKCGYENIVMTDSILTTNANKSYMKYSFVNISRIQYLKSFISNKYDNNIKTIIMSSIMHRDNVNAMLLLIRNMLSIIKMLSIKILMPKCLVYRLMNK